MSDNETFDEVCDHCGCDFPSDSPLWTGFEEQHTTYDQLMLVLNTCGYHASWHCSEACLLAATEKVRKEIVANYGTACFKCNAAIGSTRIYPCGECDKLVCEKCSVKESPAHMNFCSGECRDAKKRCTKCNMRIAKDGPDHCEYCRDR
jgi:hypothetical protein